MSDFVALRVGSPTTPQFYEEIMTKREAQKKRFSSRDRPPSAVREEPQEEWKAIRIKLVSDHLKKGQYCSGGVTQINTTLKNNITCTDHDVLTPEKEEILVKKILPEAIKLHEERLFVKRLNGPIVVPKFSDENLCSQFTTPTSADKSTEISDADMVLYVAAEPTPEGTFAWAATCATLSSNGRPVIGIINYGPRYIVATPQRVRVAAHEIAHALGFNVPEMERMQLVGRVDSLRGKTNVALVASDNTRREAMKHYNCDSAKGMELQNTPNPQKTNGRGGSGGERKVQQHTAPAGITPSREAGSLKHSLRLEQDARGVLSRPPLPRQQLLPRRERLQQRQGHLQAPRVLTASVQEEYQLGVSHSNVMDGRLTGKESVGSDVQERRGEEGSSAAKYTENVHHSSNVLSKRRSLYLQATVAESTNTCDKGKPVETATGKQCIVETMQVPPNGDKTITRSHWSRRIAKDELMVGLVGAGYYTAITMGAFADLGYYKVNWTMAEQMSWGNNSKCEFLNDTCMKNGETDFPNMFCTAKSGDIPESLQCTSDRQSLGRCSIQPYERNIPQQFQYFSEEKKVGSAPSEQMDYCPFIKALPQKSCISGEQNQMPGSKIGINSRCVEGNELRADNNAAVGAVCVEVSCKFNKVIVRYSGDEEWHSCHEGENLTVKGDVLKGEIVCPKYADVCNTINKTLDESQGPQKDPDIVEAIQTTLPEGETTSALSDGNQPATGTPKPSENAGNEGETAPVVQNDASTTKSKPSETKEENITSFLNGQNNNIIAGKGTDGCFKASVFASVMFVFLTLSVIMSP
ncbi:surface protease GP63 [Trypanosoma theileri]|uniref:Leishmanolysin-like peptidase n=1 Tax=Trypanosoma theileri TaxID=67003 RepID=A0A1X0NMI1_9TRYP|nr:surface protease GP63 [Trypanosoma theileri]ORC85349.1 surface protease GP63 [Trypanosoma theileri]